MAHALTLKNIKRQIRKSLPLPVVRRIYRTQAARYIADLKADYDPAQKTILAINHLFDQDLNALALANSKYNFIILDFAIMFRAGKTYFSKPVHLITAPYDSEPERNRMLYREECRLYFEKLTDRFHPDLILVPNDNFAFIREFIHVAHENGVPTVILDKEGTISPNSFEAEAERARKFTPFISDHVFVWSERQKAYWRNRDVSPDCITVVGQPRSDLFYSQQTDRVSGLFPGQKPLITLFSYFDDAYIPLTLKKTEGLSWKAMKTESHDFLSELAKKNPDFNFVIKCHPQQLDIDYLAKRYNHNNLRVLGGADIANELIQKSELIIAFQTTSVIEAMFMNKKIIYTAWDPNYERLKDDILPFHTASGIVIADTREKFHQVCDRFFSGNHSDFSFSEDQLEARDKFVNEYFYKPDGHVCERFFEEIGRFLS